jgi:exodeoxyribonuclease-3
MLRVITTNLNGIRSAQRKGFHEWAAAQGADFICVQEIKATEADIPDEMRRIGELDGHFHTAEKKGYSGVGIYCRRPPERLIAGFGDEEFDVEGRYLEAVYPDLAVVSLYLPSGSSSPERQEAKYRFMERFLVHLQKLRERGLEVIICGDWNIAHKEIDLKNWKSNQKNSGFLPEERAWLTRVFDELGFVDVFRRLDDRPERYTWWSNRGQAWAKNVGWRLDYQIATPGIAGRAKACDIYIDARFSDHAPLRIDYESV